MPQSLCFVSEKLRETEKTHYRENVCRELNADNVDVKGNNYCILHLPSNNKHENTNFSEIFKDRAKRQLSSFQYVYFSDEISEFDYKFTQAEVNFKNAYFKKYADFSSADFFAPVNFNEAVFCEGASFKNSSFNSKTRFESVEFHHNADFTGAKFNSSASFGRTLFYALANFQGSQFRESVSFALVHSVDTLNEDVTRIIKPILRADFSEAIFKSARFIHSHFSDVSFFKANFNGEADFWATKIYNSADFRGVTFNKKLNLTRIGLENNAKIDFGSTIFKDYIIFDNKDGYADETLENSSLNFRGATMESPEWCSFHSVVLRPHWFVDVDCRKFRFTNIEWLFADGNRKSVIAELKTLNIKSSHRLLAIACRQLAENSETNNRFEEASNFRRMAFETEWLEKRGKISNWLKKLVPESEKLKRRFGGSTNEEDKPTPPTNTFGILRRSIDFVIHGLYRISSFYGENWSWAAIVLMALVFVIFPFFYTQTEFQVSPKNIPLEVVVVACSDVIEQLKPVCKIEYRGLNFWNEAIPHSLLTATLQTVEYRIPKTALGDILTILEKILAPLQAALLALAIRRKFMR
jgi:uncharacterized protein YjbI with pentapeptide repeats